MAPLLPGRGSGNGGLGAWGIFGHVHQVGSIQRGGERERLLTTEMSHLASSVTPACSRPGAGAEVILVLGCTIRRWQSLSRSRPARGSGEAMQCRNEKWAKPTCLRLLLTTLLSYHQYSRGKLLEISTFQTNIPAFLGLGHVRLRLGVFSTTAAPKNMS